jgi:hypothetical protein
MYKIACNSILFYGVYPAVTSKENMIRRGLEGLLQSLSRIRMRIHRIHMFLGLPDPDPLVRGIGPDPDLSIIKQK